MKKIKLYQIFAFLLFINCIGFIISFFTCVSLLTEIKTFISICSIFIIGIIFSFISFYFSYKYYYTNPLNKKVLKVIGDKNIICIDINYHNGIIILERKKSA